ncbi:MAG: hypothetical protein FWC32_14315 [Firmicutes bacterium]|nr:hypothetical protein [Bacillota bacterium]
MLDLMAQFFPLMPIALIVIMVVFLVRKGRTSTIPLYIATLLLGIGAISAYAFVIDASRSGSILSGVGVIFGIIAYLIPSILMLNFALYTAVFRNITNSLEDKLKIWTAISLISFGVYLCVLLLDNRIYNWMGHSFGFGVFELIYGIIFYVAASLWIIGMVVIMWIMFIYTLKITRQRTEKIWSIIAFFLPITGSTLYLIVHFAKVLYTIPSKMRR